MITLTQFYFDGLKFKIFIKPDILRFYLKKRQDLQDEQVKIPEIKYVNPVNSV